jgi:hypothetical protein
LNASELLAEMETAAVKPCAVCALPEPFLEAVNTAPKKGFGLMAVVKILAKHGHETTDKRLKRHYKACKRG